MRADVGQEQPKLCPYCRGACCACSHGDHGEQAGENSFWGMVWDLALFLFSAAGTPCHNGPELGSQALASAPQAGLGGTCPGSAQLPVHFTISRFAMIRIVLSSWLGGWDATAGLGKPEAALSLESCWGGAVSADHFCQLPVAAQQPICAPAPFEKWPWLPWCYMA